MNEDLNPLKLNKYLYIERTPTWVVRLMYGFGLLSWLLVVVGFFIGMLNDELYRWIFGTFVIIFTFYHITSYGCNLFYKQFDLNKHLNLIRKIWKSCREPSVDVFLPICGEDIKILSNTWKYVSQLNYKNNKIYVLDDSKEDCDKHKFMADSFGFNYIERPNKGEMKKAGNLKYAYERTEGKFIAIFDADFAPHPDFLKELLPYMSCDKVGIVQSPQYFELSDRINKRSPLEYSSARLQECFYRFIQVVRDRFGSTVCCGTNAIYRRAALDEIGGTRQVGHSEDQRTGFALQSRGWIVRYIPVILAIGLSPDKEYAYFHQQNRWCAGNIDLMISKEFWGSPISLKVRFNYITGFIFYIYHLFAIPFSLQIFWVLIFYSDSIRFSNGLLFYPYILFEVIYLLFFNISPFKWGVLYAPFVRMYSYSHAVLSTIFKNSVGWVATGSKQVNISPAFRNTLIAVSFYVFVYLSLIALLIRGQVIHLFNLHYYSIQFWLFFNMFFSCLLLWQMYKSAQEIRERQAVDGRISQLYLRIWKFKTAGIYLSSLVFSFWFFSCW